MASKQINPRQSLRPKIGLMMTQPTFVSDAEDKYNELKNLTLEVFNVFKSYDMPDRQKT